MISWTRFFAIVKKEFTQMRRDRLTFAMMIGIPIIQLILFGYAINMNPRHLPTAVIAADHSDFTRRFLASLVHSNYFDLRDDIRDEASATHALSVGDIQFYIVIPPNFTQQLIRNEHPEILAVADATDPAATGNALNTITQLTTTVFNSGFTGSLLGLLATPPPVKLVIHAKYNPRAITQYNIVPGLLGVILTLTLIMITSLAITRERERNTMESLLATPVQPLEVMLGKVSPYVLVGYVQILLCLIVGNLLFNVPVCGSITLLLIGSLPFIMANLSVGILFSTVAKNQLQAIQMSIFFFLPSLLLSGFMFPFHGMPIWAQCLGKLLPMTHYLLFVRGIMLKGNDFIDSWATLWPVLLFLLMILIVGLKRYRQTLD